MNNNPFFKNFNQPYDTIPFNEYKTEHFLPALKESIKLSNSIIQDICKNEENPTFENTILKLETCHEELERVVGVYWHLFGAHSEGDFKSLAQEISPLVSAHTNDYMLNVKLFSKIKSVYDNRNSHDYDKHDLKLIDDTFKAFIRNGSSLSDDEKVLT